MITITADFKVKTQIFNNFFAKHCTLVDNNSKRLTDSLKRTSNLLSTVLFTKDDIAKIIKNFNPNKAHGFDMISIRMLKICGGSNFYVNNALRVENFPSNGKKQSLSQFIKK